MTLDNAISRLHAALDDEDIAPRWAWRVRQRLSAVKDALADEQVRVRDGWLAARAGRTDRARTQLLARVADLGSRVLERHDADPVPQELRRLLLDLERFRQRLHDLVYDSVSLELGGSE